MSDWGASFLDRLDAVERDAMSPQEHTMDLGPDFAVVYGIGDDAAYYRIYNAPDGPDADSASAEEIEKYLEDDRDRSLDFLVASCKAILVRRGDELVPIAALRDDGDATETLTFQHPEVLSLLRRAVRATTRENAWEFFKRAVPTEPRVAVALHAKDLLAWREGLLAEVGETLTKGR